MSNDLIPVSQSHPNPRNLSLNQANFSNCIFDNGLVLIQPNSAGKTNWPECHITECHTNTNKLAFSFSLM